jgi:hypothetical protein
MENGRALRAAAAPRRWKKPADVPAGLGLGPEAAAAETPEDTRNVLERTRTLNGNAHRVSIMMIIMSSALSGDSEQGLVEVRLQP